MIDEGKQRLTNVRSRLPDLKLPRAGGRDPIPLRPGRRRAPLLVLLHPAGCEACLAYARELAAHRQDIEEWDGAVRFILPEAPPDPAAWAALPFPTFVDADHRLATATGAEPPSIIVADQWEEIHSIENAGEEHDFASPDELAEWSKFLAIQCPECEGESL